MRILFVISVSLFACCRFAVGDMGSIPFVAGAKILEPTQRALIACTTNEEILILTTDLSADKETKVLEVMPLPSEPKVTKADADIFKKATDLINSKLPKMVPAALSAGGPFAAAGGDDLPAGTVTFHERIGAHDISVARVDNSAGFVKWVTDYLKKANVENPTIPVSMQKVIDQYLSDGFAWFVFDVVSLSPKPITKEAIQFRFATEFLYYPLRITRSQHGDTEVKLLILTKGLFEPNMFLGTPRSRVDLVHQPVALTGKEVSGLSEEIFEMLEKPDKIMIRNWNIRGALSSFEQDLIAGDPGKFADYERKITPTATTNNPFNVHDK